MQVWVAIISCIAGFLLAMAFLFAYRKNMKKRFLALAIIAALAALAMLAYTALTGILLSGID
jgi:hypothetical protein